MRLPRLRFTVQRMMIVVAVVSIVLASWETWQRRRVYLDYVEVQEVNLEGSLRDLEYAKFLKTRGYASDAGVHSAYCRVNHFRQLLKKYERVARFPWLPVEPDPPEPLLVD